MRKYKILVVVFTWAIFIVTPSLDVFASSSIGTIDPTYKYAWGENVGWIDFGASADPVTITDSALTGSIGNETIYFGPATRDALMRFQKYNGIIPSVGYFGPLTKATIKMMGN